MKRILTALATATVAALAMAEGISSSNVVGYNTVNVGASYVMIGGDFTKVGGGALALGELKGSFVSGDMIQVAYMSGTKVNFNAYTYMTVDTDGVDADGWYDGDFALVGDTLTIPQGSGVWFISASGSAKDVTVAGEVAQTSYTKTFAQTFNMCCDAFPVAFNPNDSRFIWNVASGDQIQVAYMSGTKVNFNAYTYMTVDTDGVDANGWYDGDFNLISAPIAAIGQGFWVICQSGSGSVTETSPLAN